MTSTTFRQTSGMTLEQEKIDADNALYSRMPLPRLNAEALYGTLLLIAGRLNQKRFSPADPVEVRKDGQVTPIGTREGWRRIIYVRQSRKQIPTHLENFDNPQMNPNCIERRDSIVALQALQLINAGMIQDLSNHFARRVNRESGAEKGKQIDRVYLIAMSRLPSDEERKISVEAREKLAEEWSRALDDSGKPDKNSASENDLAAYCHTITH